MLQGCIRPSGDTIARPEAIPGKLIEISITSNENVLPHYALGEDLWIQATLGESYAIILHNTFDRRIEVVVSVDGLNAITGEPADYRTQRGYVLSPDEDVTVAGFRTSLETVAAFQFVSSESSYAGAMAGTDNNGLIGFAVFEEVADENAGVKIATDAPFAPEAAADVHGQVLATPDRSKTDSAPSQENSAAPIKSGDTTSSVGTGFGPEVEAPAEMVPFHRADRETPSEILILHYGDEEKLRSLGIIPSDPLPPKKPDPFPGASTPPLPE